MRKTSFKETYEEKEKKKEFLFHVGKIIAIIRVAIKRFSCKVILPNGYLIHFIVIEIFVSQRH